MISYVIIAIVAVAVSLLISIPVTANISVKKKAEKDLEELTPLLQLAIEEAEKKKKQDFSKVEFLTIEEGLCVQCMHIGPFDDEPGTIARMDQYLLENGYENDFSKERFHHEIYLSDARRVAPEKWRTVIRHPIKRR